MIRSYSQFKAIISSLINNERVIWGSTLNSLFNDFVDTFSFFVVVNSTAERNAITAENRKAGMLVYVKGDTLYVLENDLTTWNKFVKSPYTKTEVNNLLSNKVDKVTGKGLSTQDFTTTLLNKLNEIAEGATRIVFLSQVPGYDRSLKKVVTYESHTPVLSVDNHTILVDATNRDIDVHLPDASLDETEGVIFVVKRIDTSGNIVRILPFDLDYSASISNPDNNQLIEFAASVSLTDRNAVSIQCHSGNWYIIN